MGKLLNGPQGQVIGSVGNNVSYVLKGQNVIKAKCRKVIKFRKLSPAQQDNCYRMTVINKFFKGILPLLKAGFHNVSIGTTSHYHNAATSYNKRHALKGEYPNLTIDFANIKISLGPLPMPLTSSANLIAEGVDFIWSYSDSQLDAKAGDQTLILLHFPALERSLQFIYGSLRSSGKEIIELPEEYQNTQMECYLSFISGDRTLVADSSYLGRLN